MRALDLGLRTALIERDRIGGTGIYNGALMSKTLWELAQRLASANALVAGRGHQPIRLSWQEALGTMNEAAFDRKYLYACHLQLLASQGERFTHIRGHAQFIDPYSVLVKRGEHEEKVRSKHFIIATGSRPRQLLGCPADEKRLLTSDGVFHMPDLPKSLVIIGAGVIGCEFATILSRLGGTQVRLIDRAERILPFEDADVSALVARNFSKSGVAMHGSSKLEHLAVEENGVVYELSLPNGERSLHHADRAMVCVGRQPNLEDLSLDRAGLTLDPGTGLLTIHHTRTSQPHIHVVGDATGSHMLVNLGEMEGRHAAELISGQAPTPLGYAQISTIMFLDPEVAGVGLNEQDCRRLAIPHRVARIEYSCIARAIAMRSTQGFFKMLVSDDGEDRILGMRAVGEHASSAIQAVALMMRTGSRVAELAELVHPHPSIIEGVQECARMLMGTSMFKSPVFNDRMRCYAWRPEEDASTEAA
jgi:dihydrolipoamide dehydrogenase